MTTATGNDIPELVFVDQLRRSADAFLVGMLSDHPEWSTEFRDGFTRGVRETTDVFTAVLVRTVGR